MKTIIEMARKAGLLPEESNIAYQHPFFEQQIERFADLVRAAEREENAKVCEKVAVDVFTQLGREHEPYMKATAEDCAMQIRARGQPKRPWVGLTHEERGAVLKSVPANNLGGEYYNKEITEIAFAVEAKLKELNT
jgi:hypothetical protein